MATVAKNARSTTINLVTGSAGPFNLGFRLFDDDAVDVFVNGVRNADWTLSSSYSDGYDDAATITFDASLDDGDAIIIEANLTPGRAADYIGSDPLLVQKMNTELARLWSSVADLHRGVARSLRGFAALDPVSGIDLNTIAEAETYATQAEAAQAAAEAARDLAISAQENLFDAWRGSWVTATAYAAGDLAREAGTTYICLIAHTSGTFSTDLSAARWAVFAQQGSAGAGTGDMLAANNLNDVASLSSARSNLEALYSQTTALSSTDLNSLSGSGLRKIGSANTNGWAGIAAGDMLLHLDYDANAAVQIGYRRDTEPLVYMRRKNAGTWGSWAAQASEAYVDAAVSGVSSRTLLATKTASASASLDFTEFDNGTYRRYEFELDAVIPATDAVSLNMLTSTDGGATYDSGASDYTWNANGFSGASATQGGAATAAAIQMNTVIVWGSDTNETGVNGKISLWAAPAATYTVMEGRIAGWSSAGTLLRLSLGGARLSAADVDACQFLFSSGNIESGTIRMFGIV